MLITMSESECPALSQARVELASVRMQLEVWRDQPDPCMDDPYGRVQPLWIGRVAGLDDEERELLADIDRLEKLTH